MLRLILVLILLVVAAAGLFFGTLNSDPVSLNYYFGSFDLSLAAALVIALVIGLVLGALSVWLGSVLPTHARNRALNRRVSVLEKETAQQGSALLGKPGDD